MGVAGATMPERAFRDGYLVGWRWIRGDHDVPTIPVCPIPAGETAYRAGVSRSARDGCTLAQELANKSEEIKSILDRARNQRPQGGQDGD